MALNGRLHIETGLSEGKTILRKTYCAQPFKLANITEDKKQTDLHLMLMSSSPGVLDGDEYDLQIAVGRGSSLHLQTQSYQRIFQMKRGAVQRMAVSLAEDSCLHYLPHPVVPHGGAIFSSETTITLGARCSLIWGEIICCGRKLNGEVFRFTSFHSLTNIYARQKLVVKENLMLLPGVFDLSGIGQLEGFTHQSTLLFINEQAPLPVLQEELASLLQSESGICFGISRLPVPGLAVRMMGSKAEQLFQLHRHMAALLQTVSTPEGDKHRPYVI